MSDICIESFLLESGINYNADLKAIPVNSPYSTFYIGTGHKLEESDEIYIPDTGDLFVTPFIGIASIFAATRGIRMPRGNYNKGYAEWNTDIPELKKQGVFDTIHMTCTGQFSNDYKPTNENTVGYIYRIDVNPIDKVFRYPWMDEEREYIIKGKPGHAIDAEVNEYKFNVKIKYINKPM